MAELIERNFEEKKVRILQQENGLWFVAIDICRAMGLKQSRSALGKLDKSEVSSVHLMDAGKPRQLNLVSESGLYTLIMRSDKPEAKRFQRWVTGEVLPSIRRTGSYLGAELEPLKQRAAELWQRKLDVVARVIAEQGLAPHWRELAEAMQGEMARCVCSQRQGQLAPFPFSFARSEPPAAFCEEFFKRLLDRLSREI